MKENRNESLSDLPDAHIRLNDACKRARELNRLLCVSDVGELKTASMRTELEQQQRFADEARDDMRRIHKAAGLP